MYYFIVSGLVWIKFVLLPLWEILKEKKKREEKRKPDSVKQHRFRLHLWLCLKIYLRFGINLARGLQLFLELLFLEGLAKQNLFRLKRLMSRLAETF